MERVPVRERHDTRGIGGVDRHAGDRGNLGHDGGVVQRDEPDVVQGRVPLEPGQDRREGVAAMQLVGAEGEHQGDAGSRQAASEEGDHIERRAIGPVEVVDDGDDVGIRGDPGEQVAQPPELRRATRYGVSNRGVRQAAEQVVDARGLGADVAALVCETAQPLEDREVGERLADLEAAAMEDLEPVARPADLRSPNPRAPRSAGSCRSRPRRSRARRLARSYAPRPSPRGAGRGRHRAR